MRKFLISIFIFSFLFRLYFNRYIFHFLLNVDEYTQVAKLFEKHGCVNHIHEDGYDFSTDLCSVDEELAFQSDYNKVKPQIHKILNFGYSSINYPVVNCTAFFRFGVLDRGICYSNSEPTYSSYLGILMVIIDQIPFSNCVLLAPSFIQTIEYNNHNSNRLFLTPACILLPYPEYPIFGKWEKWYFHAR